MITTSIISVNYNQPSVTLEFLHSVRKTTKGESIELILVDNGSHEDHSAEFEAAYPGLIYLKSSNNLGFAGGNNLGIKKARGEYLLFLNNDTELEVNLIPTLISELRENDSIGLISPLIMYFDDKRRVQYSGFSKMNFLTGRNRIQTKVTSNESYRTNYIHGAAMMCRSTDLRNIGLMDDTYFLYYEELDWCERFKRQGKEMWFTSKAMVYHKESMSVGKESPVKTYYMSRNRILFIRKNSSKLNFALFMAYYTLFALPKAIAGAIIDRRYNSIRYNFAALKWNFSNLRNPRYHRN